MVKNKIKSVCAISQTDEPHSSECSSRNAPKFRNDMKIKEPLTARAEENIYLRFSNTNAVAYCKIVEKDESPGARD